MADAATVVLLVRHGLTPTTGSSCPARPPGCTSPTRGGARPTPPPRASTALPKVAAVYSSPLERARETAAPIARTRGLARAHRARPGRLDIGEWTGLSLKQAGPASPSGRPCSATRAASASPAASRSPRCRRASPPRSARLVARHPGADRGGRVARRSDQGGGGPRPRHAARPLPAHHDRARAPSPRSAYRRGGPAVLTVNSVDGDLAWLGGARHERHRPSTSTRRTTSPPAPSGRPASASSICRRARRQPLVTLKARRSRCARWPSISAACSPS